MFCRISPGFDSRENSFRLFSVFMLILYVIHRCTYSAWYTAYNTHKPKRTNLNASTQSYKRLNENARIGSMFEVRFIYVENIFDRCNTPSFKTRKEPFEKKNNE